MAGELRGVTDAPERKTSCSVRKRRRERCSKRASCGAWLGASPPMSGTLELVARVIVLAVDQGEAFGEEPHMYNGGLGRALASLMAGARSRSRW